MIYSLIETCKRTGADPFRYLRDVLERLPSTPRERYVELTPRARLAAVHASGRVRGSILTTGASSTEDARPAGRVQMECPGATLRPSMNGGVAAAAAAAARRRREQREEEEMTGYTPEELASGSEFKILRSATSAFKRPDFLRQVLDEEKDAGWTLVEKFDNSRIRLKRSASARTDGSSTTFDPYRSYVGISETALGLRIAAAIVIGLAVVFGAIAAFVRGT